MYDLIGIQNKVVQADELENILNERRKKGDKIVFTNGCFDVLHVGHVRYLLQARLMGDMLVVGLNSDKSVRLLKGDKRPIVPDRERAELLSHLASVDYICLFDELRPDRLIERVKPDIHVKGGDYRAEDLPEAKTVERFGGKVVVVGLVEGKSTTNIIDKIIQLHAARP
jgi:rfaE bifunctional protein nucleotidyltransferase chain/domain